MAVESGGGGGSNSKTKRDRSRDGNPECPCGAGNCMVVSEAKGKFFVSSIQKVFIIYIQVCACECYNYYMIRFSTTQLVCCRFHIACHNQFSLFLFSFCFLFWTQLNYDI